MESIYGFTLEELKQKLIRKEFTAYRARQIFSWIYKKRAFSFNQMTDISQKDKEKLSNLFTFSSLTTLKKEVSRDKTEKVLFQLADKNTVEAALIPELKRKTLCLSTQVGCAFNCRFCASKKGGLVRNLKTEEIIAQYRQFAKNNKITNLVYMGIGEPLDNFKNTIKSIKILAEPAGANFTQRRISLSTCGLADKIKELADLNLRIKLSISLHAVSDKKRSRLMPVNKKYPLSKLLEAVKYWQLNQKFPVTFEYILLEGCNTEESDAKGLADLIKKTKAKLNLIPYNYSQENRKGNQLEQKEKFSQRLKKEKIIFTLRKPRGLDINAACGQLRSLTGKVK